MRNARETMDRRRRGLGDVGFTAAEVLIAATVLVVVLMAVAGMSATGTQDIQSAGYRSRAAFLAHEKLEELRNAPVFPPAPLTPAPAATDTPAAGFTRTWVVSGMTGTTPNRLATVSVTVSWGDTTGAKSVQSVTYIPEL